MKPLRLGAMALGVALLAATPAHAAAPAPPSRPTTLPLTVEERRLPGAVPREILQGSGFDDVAPGFSRALDRARGLSEAELLAADEGRRLWRRAVDRAQGRGPRAERHEGEISRDDDRPLYWARLGMTRALREWQPSFRVTSRQRAALIGAVERSSRGQDSVDLPAGGAVKRVLITGFDPFQLDSDARRSNPSGAAALALDGTTVDTPAGPARIEAVVFPVRWDDFAAGTVERTLLPHFRPGPRRVDLFTTISQGRPGRFDVERTNGAWRGGYPDNVNLSRTGVVPVPPGVPTVRPQPQWTTTTLPYAAITAARTGPYPVYDNTAVTEIPAGATEPVDRPDGPTPGSTAREGGGGDYLSNEIAYRATLLRDATRLRVPGGHLHTPVLNFGDGNTDPSTGRVSDPVFVANRLAIVAQVRSITATAVASTGTP
ncbi:pyroglutamyl peptidase [Streptomyces albireticuli]|uniref:Pyroglutamyl peptidase n=1 Tax=Streptomyces albireticuli TaxID=1940 RepID=A0A2A2DFB0_9ACTN|nr:pyroglutamyl peptidase [Streptomyces albireticuli]MCD9141890.1 pyroglutamyl peptidase [Streptomyces albireticuli]MCD9163166.1 pyroglutamyl peptidase [Streptomyces albireticuli]MCD9190064.1 pyroglutamyl peptidase [Streptomyces albireticuli]PAU50127.1 pyroglutamyl peptidase [Streptomyces albireticuli]